MVEEKVKEKKRIGYHLPKLGKHHVIFLAEFNLKGMADFFTLFMI